MDKQARNEFAETVMIRSIVAKYVAKRGMEHDSPEAQAKYLKDHPNADKANHTVKKTDKGEGGKKDEPKGEKDKGKKDEGGKDDMTPKPGKKEQEMGGEIQQWQGPGTPAINSVGSYLTGGHPVSKSKVRDAIKELESTSRGDPDAKKLITKMKKFIGD